jgi:hypothetical protein
MSLEHLNINKLHPDPIEKKEEETALPQYDIANGYTILERGRKVQRWVDSEGNWQEKQID